MVKYGHKKEMIFLGKVWIFLVLVINLVLALLWEMLTLLQQVLCHLITHIQFVVFHIGLLIVVLNVLDFGHLLHVFHIVFLNTILTVTMKHYITKELLMFMIGLKMNGF